MNEDITLESLQRAKKQIENNSDFTCKKCGTYRLAYYMLNKGYMCKCEAEEYLGVENG